MENASSTANDTIERYLYYDLLRYNLSLFPVLAFVYINSVMLFTLRRKAAFQGVSRYILFGHMLFADTLQLQCSMVSYIFAMIKVYMNNGLCGILLSLASITTRITPFNLAVMALERYSAICFPLRHAEIATSKWTGVAIGVVWVLSSLFTVIRFFLFLAIGLPFFAVQPYCSVHSLFNLKIYSDMNKAFTAIYFIFVGLIIIYTYIAIMIQANSALSDKSKAVKARNTVLLHLIQLGLCLFSFAVGIFNSLASRLEVRTRANIRYVNFIVFIIFPRCLSPLIYGLRDAMFRPVFIFYFTFGRINKIKPEVD